MLCTGMGSVRGNLMIRIARLDLWESNIVGTTFLLRYRLEMGLIIIIINGYNNKE